jgi:hypothetical protein
MRTAFPCVALFLLGTLAFSATPADVTYVEGEASIRPKSGVPQDAQIGDLMNTGDTLRTGADGIAELAQKSVIIKISRNTVFTLMEKDQGGQTASVLSVALGSIKFRYDKLTGREPMVRTNGATAGVRGTEFSVFAGADGSTLIAVDSGQVTVESEGKSVDLAANEGVEVPLGKPPGEKIKVQSDQIDYRAWNDGKLAAMLVDPRSALASIETAMAGYIASVADFAARYAESSKQLEAEREKRKQIGVDKGKEEAARYEDEVVTPLALNTGYLFLNVRFNSLAALSLRRYVAGRLYVFLKARFIVTPADAAWTGFLDRYAGLLQSFETSIAPHLVAGDI